MQPHVLCQYTCLHTHSRCSNGLKLHYKLNTLPACTADDYLIIGAGIMFGPLGILSVVLLLSSLFMYQ